MELNGVGGVLGLGIYVWLRSVVAEGLWKHKPCWVHMADFQTPLTWVYAPKCGHFLIFNMHVDSLRLYNANRARFGAWEFFFKKKLLRNLTDFEEFKGIQGCKILFLRVPKFCPTHCSFQSCTGDQWLLPLAECFTWAVTALSLSLSLQAIHGPRDQGTSENVEVWALRWRGG